MILSNEKRVILEMITFAFAPMDCHLERNPDVFYRSGGRRREILSSTKRFLHSERKYTALQWKWLYKMANLSLILNLHSHRDESRNF